MLQESYLSKLSLLFNTGGCDFSAVCLAWSLCRAEVLHGNCLQYTLYEMSVTKEQLETQGLHLH